MQPPDRIKISPQYTKADLDAHGIDLLPAVVQDQIEGCLLKFAKHLIDEEHSGIAVLMLCSSIFEPLGRMRGHPITSEDAFVEGCKHVFGPELVTAGNTSKLLYKFLRCGLYHEAFVKHGIVLSSETAVPFHVRDGTLTIDPHAFLEATERGIKNILTSLKAIQMERAVKPFTSGSKNKGKNRLKSSRETLRPSK